MFQFWFEIGLRPGEVIALSWLEIDFANRVARIDCNFVVGVEKLPKTEAGIRNVEFSDLAIAYLIRQKTYTHSQEGRVFYHPKKNQPWRNDQEIRRVWKRLLSKAEVRYRNPYQIRHTFATHHVSSGSNLWWLANQMGHETVEMIIRHYGRWMPEVGGRRGSWQA